MIIVKGVIDVSLGIFEEPVFIESNYSGVYFIYSNNEGMVCNIIDKTLEEKSIIKKNIEIKVGDEVTKIKESADRLGYYIYLNSARIKADDLIKLVVK